MNHTKGLGRVGCIDFGAWVLWMRSASVSMPIGSVWSHWSFIFLFHKEDCTQVCERGKPHVWGKGSWSAIHHRHQSVFWEHRFLNANHRRSRAGREFVSEKWGIPWHYFILIMQPWSLANILFLEKNCVFLPCIHYRHLFAEEASSSPGIF